MNQLKQFTRSYAISRVLRSRDPMESQLQEYLKIMPKYKKVRENMKRFQKEDGVPIFLKAGLRDKLNFYAIVGATVGSLAYNWYLWVPLFWLNPVWYSETVSGTSL